MPFSPVGDIQLDADVADVKSKKTAYLSALAARDAAQTNLTQKQTALDAAQAALVTSANTLENDAVSFKTF